MFTVYITWEDTRSRRLSIYGRTDVNIIVNINPVTRQVMIVGIPRDIYVYNPTLDNDLDKLTHLGNNGIQNTTKGVSNYYGIDINYYRIVNFNTFKYIVDTLGGLMSIIRTIFSSFGDEEFNIYYYKEGLIHLDGSSTLSYVGERHNLSNGDYDHSEHQTIVLKTILQKLMSIDSLGYYDDLLNALKGQFLSSIELEDIYKLIAMQLNVNSPLDIISYHMGWTGDIQGTVSMGWDRKLYVVHPQLLKKQIEKMKNNEILTQQTLSDEKKTYYIPN